MLTLGFFIGQKAFLKSLPNKNMKKLFLLLIISFVLLMPIKVHAQTPENTSAKLLTQDSSYASDSRVKILKAYLEQYNSPLANHASTFIQAADKYNLDWRLVPAISGVESTFGQAIPSDSYNGWGWGVYGDNVIRFTSWDDAINTISQGLRERYLGNSPVSDPYAIGPTYAASPTWASRVDFFMEQMHTFEVLNAKDSLSISI